MLESSCASQTNPHSVADPGFMKGRFQTAQPSRCERDSPAQGGNVPRLVLTPIAMPFVPLSKKLLRIVHTLGF